ncbi:hypothetical protein [Neobacillus mesonae]|uniref:hypothetical protein n=1 Tax=Neobacillus mesonae TaxID=1193713 RepID=UPI00203C9E52|nr:hypothetical protein [Neobacillus mesonae]MCM3569231.1 hypothetical protein [Neobacillus mesonae]
MINGEFSRKGVAHMVLFISSIILFNSITFKMKKHLTKNQVVHIWTFTMVLLSFFDVYIDQIYEGYWYFEKGIDWKNLCAYSLLIPPVNVMILNWYPWLKKLCYLALWILFIIVYENLALLPETWGYFHYGWWKFRLSLILDPILLATLLTYFRWIRKIEKS